MRDKLVGCYLEAKESKEEVTSLLLVSSFLSDLLCFFAKTEIDLFNI